MFCVVKRRSASLLSELHNCGKAREYLWFTVCFSHQRTIEQELGILRELFVIVPIFHSPYFVSATPGKCYRVFCSLRKAAKAGREALNPGEPLLGECVLSAELG